MSTAAEELSEAYVSVSGYFGSLGSSASSTGSRPSLKDLVDSLSYDELLRRATQGAGYSADAAVAAAVEECHNIEAIAREYTIVSKTKLELFGDLEADYSNEEAYYSDRGVLMKSILLGETRTPYLG